MRTFIKQCYKTSHPAMMALGRRLECSAAEAVGLTGDVLWWASDLARNGRRNGFLDEDIDAAAGKPSFAEAAANREIGIFKRVRGKLHFIEWDFFFGNDAERREQNARSSRRYREKQNAKNNGENGPCVSADGQHRQDKTRQEQRQTRREEIRQRRPSVPAGLMLRRESSLSMLARQPYNGQR